MEKTITIQEAKLNALIEQVQDLRNLSLGTLETLKRVSGYETALNQLREDMKIDSSKTSDEPQELIK